MEPENPSVCLRFRFAGVPPRRTHQGGVRYCHDRRVRGGVRVYIDADHVNEAWQIRDAIRRNLPEGWKPSTEPVELDIWLIYPQRKSDNLPDGVLIPHTEAPDADNLVKSIQDAGQRAGLYANDAQVFDLHTRKFRGTLPRWGINVRFGGYGYFDGRKMPMEELQEAIREWRKQERAERRKRKASGADGGQGTLALGGEGT